MSILSAIGDVVHKVVSAISSVGHSGSSSSTASTSSSSSSSRATAASSSSSGSSSSSSDRVTVSDQAKKDQDRQRVEQERQDELRKLDEERKAREKALEEEKKAKEKVLEEERQKKLKELEEEEAKKQEEIQRKNLSEDKKKAEEAKLKAEIEVKRQKIEADIAVKKQALEAEMNTKKSDLATEVQGTQEALEAEYSQKLLQASGPTLPPNFNDMTPEQQYNYLHDVTVAMAGGDESAISKGMDLNITDKNELVDTQRVRSTLWGESKFSPLLITKGVENPYELIPDFYYSDILPYVIDDIRETCRNDTERARKMILALPAVSHLGQVITISDEEEYNKNIEIVKLGRNLLDQNLDPGKYMTNGASKMNISIGKSVADDLPQIIDSIYNEYEQEKNPNSDFNFVLKIADGYRDFTRQQQARISAGKASAARPGESQHHTGLAFDAYYTSTQGDICAKFNGYGVVCPFMDEEKSGMVDPPHFFYLDGYMPGLTETTMNYFIRNGMDPMDVNDINVINQVLLGVSQTIESELSTEKNPYVDQRESR